MSGGLQQHFAEQSLGGGEGPHPATAAMVSSPPLQMYIKGVEGPPTPPSRGLGCSGRALAYTIRESCWPSVSFVQHLRALAGDRGAV